MKKIIKNNRLVPIVGIETSIFLVRGQKVMFDADLARLYGVETKALNRAVKRNLDRFPIDFRFQLSREELKNMRYQFGTASRRNARFHPFAFTQEGIAMLSSVLRSPRAVQVNIEIMRAFVRLRGFLLSQNELVTRLATLEKKHDSHSAAIQEIFSVIKKLMLPPKPPRAPKREIGFHTLFSGYKNPKQLSGANLVPHRHESRRQSPRSF
jgi:hypothetical protein